MSRPPEEFQQGLLFRTDFSGGGRDNHYSRVSIPLEPPFGWARFGYGAAPGNTCGRDGFQSNRPWGEAISFGKASLHVRLAWT